MELLTAFTIGLLGSLHCVGMCGPIAFALPLNRKNNFSLIAGSFSYNMGRLITYFLLGAAFGLLGKGFAMAGFQRWLSIAVGLGMILSIALPYFYQKNLPHFTFMNSFLSSLKHKLSQQFGKKSIKNLVSIGLLNGLLPCGLVYLALAGATAMATPVQGGLFMFFFGLGTLPLMMAVAVLGSKVRLSFRKQIRKIIPVFVILIGCVFILRGMNLGIPYLSPKLQSETKVVSCH